MNALLKAINEVLSEAGRESVSKLEPQMRLRTDLGFDSIELAILTVKIEDACGVDVFADGLVATVGEIQAKIDGR